MQSWPPKEPYCPHCGQPAPKTMPPLDPGVTLTLAERLVWAELARTPGYAVPKWRLEQYCAPGSETIRAHMTRLRRKTGRVIRSVYGDGYLLEPEGTAPRRDGRRRRRSQAPSPRPIRECSATR